MADGRWMALDGVVMVVELLRRARYDGPGVVRHRRHGVRGVLGQLGAVLDDGDRVDVACLRLEEDVHGAPAGAVARAVSLVVLH